MIKAFRAQDHQGKGAAYFAALMKFGWHQSRYIHGKCAFGLSDSDWRQTFIDPLVQSNIPVFLYPHAARPMIQYDGCVKARPEIRCMFTIAEGGIELMQRIGYPCPVEAVGWTMTEIKPFQPAAMIRTILFAPIHPNGNGYLHEVDKDLNRRTYQALSAWCKKSGANLMVRYIHKLSENGLDKAEALHEPFVEWLAARPNGNTSMMYQADLIVAHQTYAWMAIALGKPTLMFGEDVPPRSGNREDGFTYVTHWEDYKDYLMFPMDILNQSKNSNGLSVDEWIKLAASSDDLIKDWKKRFIGKPFQEEHFVRKLESYL